MWSTLDSYDPSTDDCSRLERPARRVQLPRYADGVTICDPRALADPTPTPRHGF